MRGVVGDLLLASAAGPSIARPSTRGDLVGIHAHLARDIAGGAGRWSDERAGRAEEALLVGVEDADERDLRQVEALAEQVDADEDVDSAEPQLAEQLDPAQVSISEWR